MKPIERIVFTIGTLDVLYIIWLITNAITSGNGTFIKIWEELLAYGLPFPEIQFTFIISFYLSIFVCGISLILQFSKLAWLNYVQFPFRLIMVVSTLYPIFYLLGKAGINLGVIVTMILLTAIEVIRVTVIYRWQHNAT